MLRLHLKPCLTAILNLKAEVTKLEQQPDHTWEVTTPQGSIRAKRVVNATGFWGREFSSLVSDYNVPLAPIQHQYVVSKSVPELKELPCELPVLRHLEASFYLRYVKHTKLDLEIKRIVQWVGWMSHRK